MLVAEVFAKVVSCTHKQFLKVCFGGFPFNVLSQDFAVIRVVLLVFDIDFAHKRYNYTEGLFMYQIFYWLFYPKSFGLMLCC